MSCHDPTPWARAAARRAARGIHAPAEPTPDLLGPCPGLPIDDGLRCLEQLADEREVINHGSR